MCLRAFSALHRLHWEGFAHASLINTSNKKGPSYVHLRRASIFAGFLFARERCRHHWHKELLVLPPRFSASHKIPCECRYVPPPSVRLSISHHNTFRTVSLSFPLVAVSASMSSNSSRDKKGSSSSDQGQEGTVGNLQLL